MPLSAATDYSYQTIGLITASDDKTRCGQNAPGLSAGYRCDVDAVCFTGQAVFWHKSVQCRRIKASESATTCQEP